MFRLTEHLPGIYGLAPNMIELTNYGNSMDCLKKEIEKAKTLCQPWSTPVPSTGDNYFDDCVVGGYFMQNRCHSGVSPYPVGPWAPVTACDYYIWGGSVWKGNEGQIYLDRNCNALPYPAPGVRVCDAGFLNWKVSPISLVWPAGSAEDDTFSAASFPLNPGKTGKSYKWRASEKLPLLVYDPSHSGRITSAFQLFGEWTFGGKRTASADAASREAKWADGYEALATMDTDKDGVVSGDELETLGLWFDSNRNGVSENGEVLPVADLGIGELYYTPDSRDNVTSTIRAGKGYKVRTGGKEEFGSSIDWYGEEAHNSFDLVQRQLAENTLSALSATRAGHEAAPENSAKELRHNSALDITGAWLWKGEGNVGAGQDLLQGILVFQQNKKGELVGHSLVETPFREGVGEYRSMIQLLPFTGTKSGDGKNEVVKFVVPRPDGSEVANTAKLSEDGKTLRGTSLAQIKFRGEKGEIKYNWTASKME